MGWTVVWMRIIAILAAMLLPVLSQARQVAWSTACLNNEKQLGTGSIVYVDNHDGQMFFGAGSGNGGAHTPTWDTLLYTATHDLKINRCPADRTPVHFWPYDHIDGTRQTEPVKRSYAMNSFTWDAWHWNPNSPPQKCNISYRDKSGQPVSVKINVIAPDTWLFTDWHHEWQLSGNWSRGRLFWPYTHTETERLNRGTVPVHPSRKNNFLFIDGHARGAT